MKLSTTLIPLALAAVALSSPAARAQDNLAAGFASPPAVAKPHTWWHWMNGNVTREGITADLEAMKRIGLGGAQIFNVSESIPEGPIAYNSPEWRAMVKHAAAEADRLGLELCIHNCAGWSRSGGPWVQPQDAMQTVVINETRAHGPGPFAADLPQPHTNHNFYRDIAVLAFPTPPTPKDDATRIPDFKAKALYDYTYGQQPSLAPTPPEAAIGRDAVVDLTPRFKDAKLSWEVPAGDWTILRIGYTPTGAVNAPAPTSGRGLEVDKLSREAFDRYWAGGMEPLLKDLGPLAGKSLRNVLIDSYEVGCQNWSPRFREEFTRRRGYDPLVFLPTMTGRIIDSSEVSERFLWDLRRTVADLFADNYFSYAAEVCHKNGLLSSVEPYDGPFECSQVGRDADIIMGEFWVNGGMHPSCKLAASSAHVFGRAIVGAESFTATPEVGGWRNHPASLKAVGDLMFTVGINRCIIHRYAHQPWLNVEPGMTMGQWGTHFERTSTWWDHGGPEWVQYLARCQFLLQQGRFSADVLFFAGECAPNGAPNEPALKARGYDYDTCGADTLAHATVRDGSIVLASGMTYRLLVLPDTPFMTPALLERIAALVKAGATVIGPAPSASPTLKGYPADDAAVKAQAQTLWTPADKAASARTGVAVAGVTPEQMLTRLGVAPDATFAPLDTRDGKLDTAWIHRIVGDTDVYFISNQKRRSIDVDCSFRVTGKAPELWRPDTGAIDRAPMWREESGRTVVTLRLEPAGSVFVVFRPGAAAAPDHIISISRPDAPVPHIPTIEIKKARYEATDGAGGVDVTAKVAAMIAAGATEIPASNSAFGDPTYNHVKRLVVEYTIDAKPVTSSTPENGTLILVEPGPDTPAAFTFATGANGTLDLRTFETGVYEVCTSDGAAKKLSVTSLPAPVEITGPWAVAFQPGRGAPAGNINIVSLASWTVSSDPGIKYFSGTAAYEKSFELPTDTAARPLILDLGSVHEIAEVTLNGTKLPTLWKPPYTLDITTLAKPGTNTLSIKITNLWANRLIGDEQFPEDEQWARGGGEAPSPLKAWPAWFAPVASSPNATLANRTVKERLTFTTWKHWQKDSPLLESGLIGPVTIRAGERHQLIKAR